MRFPFFRPRRDPQVWPCGPDCAFARPFHTATGDWIWCEHPDAATRLRHAGLECGEFRAPGSLPESTDLLPEPLQTHALPS